MKHVMLCTFLLIAAVARAESPPKVEFKDGDRIAFVGNEFFEREQDQGYIETQLATRFPEKHLTFRNLGYSGDTVWADARALCAGWATFGPPDQGFNRLKDLVGQVKPTVIFVAYGMNESFEGEKGLARFEQGLSRMLDMLEAQSRARLVLFTPIRHENLPRPLPDPTRHNVELRMYCDAIIRAGEQRHCPVIDLYKALGDGTQAEPPAPYTRDGIHLTPYGYWRVAQVIERELGYAPRQWEVQIDRDGKHQAQGTKLSEISSINRGLRFTAADELLPIAPAPAGAPESAKPAAHRVLRVTALKPATYVLKSGDQAIVSATSGQWEKGVELPTAPGREQEEQLRKLIISKNADFFNYSRPQNDTYIFGYRNHEQGRNAVEIPRFLPLVEQKEKEIDKLLVPSPHTYELVREN